MALEARVSKIEAVLQPTCWLYTTSWYAACESADACVERLRAQWRVGSADLDPHHGGRSSWGLCAGRHAAQPRHVRGVAAALS
jgi:hypothetical protein